MLTTARPVPLPSICHYCCYTDVSEIAKAVLLDAGASVVLPKPTPRGLLEKVMRSMITNAAPSR
jgi:hypothetical protein